MGLKNVIKISACKKDIIIKRIMTKRKMYDWYNIHQTMGSIHKDFLQISEKQNKHPNRKMNRQFSA